MATRQYIGARYVIKIYENSQNAGSADWEANVNYEPLTMVTYNYGSYLSKKIVPATVGNPVDNPIYWVQTGFYNGQIANLQEQIDAINLAITGINSNIGDLDNLTTLDKDSIVDAINEVNASASAIGEFARQYAGKNILIAGDSLSVASNTWAKSFAEMAESYGCTVTNISTGGFNSTQLYSAVLGLTGSYDLAIVWCGINDANNAYPVGFVTTENSYSYNMKGIFTKLLTLNPSCKIFALGITYGEGITLARAKSSYYYNAALYQICKLYGVAFKDISNMIGAAYYNKNSLYPDGVHFTEAESNGMLYNTILNKILTACSDDYKQIVMLSNSDCTAGTNIVISQINGPVSIGEYFMINGYITATDSIPNDTTIITLPESFKASAFTRVQLIDASGIIHFALLSQSNEVKTDGVLPAGAYRIIGYGGFYNGANIGFLS